MEKTESSPYDDYGYKPHRLFPWLTDLEVGRMIAENYLGFYLWRTKHREDVQA